MGKCRIGLDIYIENEMQLPEYFIGHEEVILKELLAIILFCKFANIVW